VDCGVVCLSTLSSKERLFAATPDLLLKISYPTAFDWWNGLPVGLVLTQKINDNSQHFY
jgi:hypothetical protein